MTSKNLTYYRFKLNGEKVKCTDHSYAWSGKTPCTGVYRCVHCGKPEDENTFDGKKKDDKLEIEEPITKEWLKENLTINVNSLSGNQYDNKGIEVSLYLEGKEISFGRYYFD